MKILLEPYNPTWRGQFQLEKTNIETALAHLDIVVEHIGSTSVEGMTAKPIIDVLVGLSKTEELNETVAPMLKSGYSYVNKFENQMPYRRLFIKADIPPQIIGISDNRKFGVEILALANIHIIPFSSIHFERHIAFKEFLRAHKDVRQQYIDLKLEITKLDLKDHNQYNLYKNDFIKDVEAKATRWYRGAK